MISHILFTANEVITNDYTNTHQAIDVVGENRSISDVIAYEDGTVVFVVNNVKTNNTNTTGNATYGNFIKIKHNNNVQTLYAHLKYGSIKVKSGDTVKKGQVLCVIEAMKLENAVQSNMDGKILEIKATKGAMVASKDVLFVIG